MKKLQKSLIDSRSGKGLKNVSNLDYSELMSKFFVNGIR